MSEQTPHDRLFTFEQDSAYHSPVKMRYRVGTLLFAVVWAVCANPCFFFVTIVAQSPRFVGLCTAAFWQAQCLQIQYSKLRYLSMTLIAASCRQAVLLLLRCDVAPQLPLQRQTRRFNHSANRCSAPFRTSHAYSAVHLGARALSIRNPHVGMLAPATTLSAVASTVALKDGNDPIMFCGLDWKTGRICSPPIRFFCASVGVGTTADEACCGNAWKYPSERSSKRQTVHLSCGFNCRHSVKISCAPSHFSKE